MTNVFVKIDGDTKKLKIQSKEEESFKKISIGDVSKNTLSNIFLKALDDSDMQSPSIQTEIDTEQNFWKHFFQQKDIDSDYFIYSILKNYIELFLKNLEEEKDNLAEKEGKIQELEKEPTSENAEREQCVSQKPPTSPTTESSETTPLESTKLLELQKARIEWLQNSISIAKNKDRTTKRLNKLEVVINKTSLSDKVGLISKIQKENTNLEINDQKLDEALINAYCSTIGEKNISIKIGEPLSTLLRNENILTDNVEIKKFEETLQNHVKSLTPQSNDVATLLRTDF